MLLRLMLAMWQKWTLIGVPSCPRGELNSRPLVYKTSALTTELRRPTLCATTLRTQTVVDVLVVVVHSTDVAPAAPGIITIS